MVAREPYRSLSGLALAPWRLSPGCRAVAGPEPSRSLNIYNLLMNHSRTDVKLGDAVLEKLEREHERGGKGCGLTRSRCHRGNGERRDEHSLSSKLTLHVC